MMLVAIPEEDKDWETNENLICGLLGDNTGHITYFKGYTDHEFPLTLKLYKDGTIDVIKQ